MSENLIASLQVGRNAPSMPVEEYRARKVALVTGKFDVLSWVFGHQDAVCMVRMCLCVNQP